MYVIYHFVGNIPTGAFIAYLREATLHKFCFCSRFVLDALSILIVATKPHTAHYTPRHCFSRTHTEAKNKNNELYYSQFASNFIPAASRPII